MLLLLGVFDEAGSEFDVQVDGFEEFFFCDFFVRRVGDVDTPQVSDLTRLRFKRPVASHMRALGIRSVDRGSSVDEAMSRPPPCACAISEAM